MIPLRDTIPSTKYPVVNTGIIIVNVAVFCIQHFYINNEAFIYAYGLVPVRYTDPSLFSGIPLGFQLFSLVSFMFLHGGFWHLLGNMWSLYIFGDNIEDKLGHVRYLLFYLLCGLSSGLFHLVLNLHSQIPVIGASGAIAGVMGAYFVLFPKSRILTFIPIFFIPWFMEIPAFVFLGFWFLLQVFNATTSASSGIAWFAHIGGFIAGILLLKLMPEIKGNKLFVSLNEAVRRTGTPKFQTVNTAGVGENPDLYGTLLVSPREAFEGATKIINIPWGRFNRLYKVSIPGGTMSGKRLRLKGLGANNGAGQAGDLYLRIVIQ
jgi:hypothetical protein